MIREFGETIGRTVLDTVGRAASRVQERKPLPVDLLESDDAYLAVFDAPGATASDVQVRFDEGVVQVRVDRFRAFHEGFEMRFPGRGLALDGEVALPDGARVDAAAATATLTDRGTLQVEIPRRHDPDDAAVDIETSDEGDAGAADDPDGDGTAADGSAEAAGSDHVAPDEGDA